MKKTGPKVLLLDIETAPILARVWGLYDQTIALNQIKSDWFILAWAAKWLGDPESLVIYHDQRRARNPEKDGPLLKPLWKLLDEADIIVTQNGKSFDARKLNARFILNGFKPPSSYKHIDTKLIAKKHFGFTSNKLEYMTDKLCTKYKKLTKRKFAGMELWNECLEGNLSAWKEMEKYNKYDVLSLEELYLKLQPWETNPIRFALYGNDSSSRVFACNCGSKEFIRNGFAYTPRGRYQRFRCSKCGAENRSTRNLVPKLKEGRV